MKKVIVLAVTAFVFTTALGQEHQASPTETSLAESRGVLLIKAYNRRYGLTLMDKKITNQAPIDQTPRFNSPAGTIIGWLDKGVIRATGIPYAYADRFGLPVSLAPSAEPIMATEWAPACPQAPVPFLDQVLGSSPIAHLSMNEHCQQLSITLPVDRLPTEKLPVMVWIHGGSYISGAGDATVFDSRELVQEQRVVVVSITYRLGLFGFLGGYCDRAANLGLLDMIEALRWIKTNISSFGGDPNSVTLFGQSAGGDAVAHLMIADGTQGLFQRVIIQSAPLGISHGRQQMTKAMTDVAAGIPPNALVDELVARQASVSAAAAAYGLKAGMAFGTQYGYAPLPNEEDLEEAWLRSASRYDVLIGCADSETSLFIPAFKSVQKYIRLPLVGGLLKRLFIRVTTREVYRRPALAFAKRQARGGGRVYAYTIHWGSKTNGFGATHTIDLPLLFGNQETWQHAELVKGIPWADILDNGQKMRALWAQFARSGQLDRKGAINHKVLSYKRL